MKYARLLLLVAATSIVLPVRAQVNTSQAWEDAHVIRRVATVAGKGMPEELLTKLAHGIVTDLRGKQPDGTWQWAYYTREEARKTEENYALKSRKGEETPAPVELKGSLGYRVRLSVPSRRYLIARNRGIAIQRAIVEYTNSKGAKVSQEFPVDLKLPAGEHADLELTEFAFNPVVRVWGWSDEKIGKNASLVIQIFEPTLVDNMKSPYFSAVQQAHALPKAIDREDVTEVRKLCDSIAATIESVSPEAAAEARAVSARAEVPFEATPATASHPQGNAELNRKLQEIEDLLTGTAAERSEGMTKLHQLVRSTRQ